MRLEVASDVRQMKTRFSTLKGIFRLVIGLSVVGLVVLLVVGRSARLGATFGALTQQEWHGDFKTWSYTAARTDTGIHAVIRYDKSTKESLRAYVEENQRLATLLSSEGGEAQTNLTFRTYVPPERFRSWATAVGLKVKDSQLSVVDAHGTEGILGIIAQPGDSDPLPQERIDSGVYPLQLKMGGVREIRGIFFSRGTVDAKQLPLIAHDPLVFIADVTPNVVRNELIAASADGAEQAVVDIDPLYAFGEMQSFGLDYPDK